MENLKNAKDVAIALMWHTTNIESITQVSRIESLTGYDIPEEAKFTITLHNGQKFEIIVQEVPEENEV